MAKNNSEHILSSSSNLLGFCLVVLTSLKISRFNEQTLIDELTGVACILLVLSSFFSFYSIRSDIAARSAQFEQIADNIFIAALALIFAITIMIAFSVFF